MFESIENQPLKQVGGVWMGLARCMLPVYSIHHCMYGLLLSHCSLLTFTIRV